MSEEDKDMAKGKDEAVRITQGRSPAYPYVDLRTAVERAEQIRDAGAARTDMPPETIYKIWKIGAQSSKARQTLAALNHYDLVDYVGRGKDRRAKLSELALRIVFDKQPDSKERLAAIQQAATNPSIHAELWERYGPLLPDDVVLETFLVRDRDYNPQAAKSIISKYRDTLEFAKMDKPGNMPVKDSGGSIPPETPEVGDLIQWEVDGILKFEAPRRIRAIQTRDEETWVFVDGSDTGIPMEQVTLQKKGRGGDAPRPIPPTLAEEKSFPGTGARKEVFALDEGDVVLTFPENLSPESYTDLESHLQLFLRKAKRRAEKDRQDKFNKISDMIDGKDDQDESET